MTENPEFGDKYRLIWRKPGDEKIAEVRNYTLDETGHRRVDILLDDRLMKRIKMRFLASQWDSTGPKILVSNAFMVIPRSFREAGIWHEVGHIHHEHHLLGEFCDQSQIRASRIMAIEKGTVLPFEQQADRFAVLHSGKEAVIGFLEYLVHTRPSGGKLGWNMLGKRELEMRIEAIRTY